jgi:hypothetical protein
MLAKLRGANRARRRISAMDVSKFNIEVKTPTSCRQTPMKNRITTIIHNSRVVMSSRSRSSKKKA